MCFAQRQRTFGPPARAPRMFHDLSTTCPGLVQDLSRTCSRTCCPFCWKNKGKQSETKRGSLEGLKESESFLCALERVVLQIAIKRRTSPGTSPGQVLDKSWTKPETYAKLGVWPFQAQDGWRGHVWAAQLLRSSSGAGPPLSPQACPALYSFIL